ncbi:hypothetical protein [Bacteroides sp.]|uniref:hypothetical protein n=1 Tax=Bacteroides sp. TaxID=29523 RepID=UPI002602582A|nr:hypothetical protein [Bacteroides sp.]MDD3036471.1 hypothetical protein [Bacteroides sp.]
MDEKRIEELINKALREESSLPSGLSERLEQKIDLLAKEEMRTGNRSSTNRQLLPRRKMFYWMGGIAAAILGAVLFVFTETDAFAVHPVDTYTDPQEAAMAAQNALALMSANLNKGITKVNKTSGEIYKMNKIFNKQLNNE